MPNAARATSVYKRPCPYHWRTPHYRTHRSKAPSTEARSSSMDVGNPCRVEHGFKACQEKRFRPHVGLPKEVQCATRWQRFAIAGGCAPGAACLTCWSHSAMCMLAKVLRQPHVHNACMPPYLGMAEEEASGNQHICAGPHRQRRRARIYTPIDLHSMGVGTRQTAAVCACACAHACGTHPILPL